MILNASNDFRFNGGGKSQRRERITCDVELIEIWTSSKSTFMALTEADAELETWEEVSRLMMADMTSPLLAVGSQKTKKTPLIAKKSIHYYHCESILNRLNYIDLNK